MSIPIFKAEKEAGLYELIQANASIAYVSPLNTAPTGNAIELAKAEKMIHAVASNEGQIDLHYLKTIMVTTGWNLNDDVFDNKEMWVARYSPEDKPFNLEHDPRRVRGHITGNYVMDVDGNVLANNLSVDELPNKYHVVTTAVLYKFLKSRDEELEKEMKQIIAEIGEGKWFVSMECLFSDFDYAVSDTRGKTTILSRNEESAFLTKHLRAYGGKGQYEEYKIGRVLRNITFSGKGLVAKPANPESIIFANVAEFKPVAQKQFTHFKTETGYNLSLSGNNSIKESDRMADTNTNEVVLAERLKSVESTLSAVNKKNEELEKRLQDSNEKEVQAKLSSLEAQVKSTNEKLASVEAQVKVEQTARTEAEAKLVVANKKASELETQVAQANAEKTKATRISAWVERTGSEQAVAAKTVDSLSKLSDEEFNNFLETQPTKASNEKTDDQKKKEADDKAKADAAAKAAQTDKSKLDNVETPKDATLANAGVDSGVEQTRASLSEYLGKSFLSKGRTKTNKE